MAGNHEKLVAWRRLKGWTQTEAAARYSEHVGYDVPQGTWAPWETGKKSPDRTNAPALESFTDGVVRAADWPTRKRRRRRARVTTAEKRTGTDG